MPLDIGIGILVAIGLAPFFGIGESAYWIALGILFSLLPDIDALLHWYRYGRGSDHVHRELLHAPIPYLFFGTGLLCLVSLPAATLFAICSFLHFVHDSIGIGWGVQWLRPFSSDHFSFLYLYKPASKPALPHKLMYRWRHEDIERLDRKHGDQAWLYNIYVRLHPYALAEFLIFGVAAVALYRFFG